MVKILLKCALNTNLDRWSKCISFLRHSSNKGFIQLYPLLIASIITVHVIEKVIWVGQQSYHFFNKKMVGYAKTSDGSMNSLYIIWMQRLVYLTIVDREGGQSYVEPDPKGTTVKRSRKKGAGLLEHTLSTL